MTITEKVAYLKGMADGMELSKETSKESKLLTAIIDTLEDIGFAVEDLEEAAELLNEGLDAVSEDLEDVESLLFDDEDEDCGCGCGSDCDCDEDDDFFELECESCGAELVVDEDVLTSGKIICSKCGESFAIELIDDDGEEEADED